MNDPFVRPVRAPLYVEVRDAILKRIADGGFAPGALLPAETALGQEYGVSQGTVRKALDDLAARNLVVRRQGKGTFVAAHTPERALFHFFHIAADDGSRQLPTKSRVVSVRRRRATQEEADALDLPRGERILEIVRVREMQGAPAIHEWIAVPAALFPDLDKRSLEDVPNELYQHYEERYGVTVHRAVERLRAVAASAEDAARLGISAGSPLLEIERVAQAPDGRAVERRVSRCRTEGRHYLSTIE